MSKLATVLSFVVVVVISGGTKAAQLNARGNRARCDTKSAERRPDRVSPESRVLPLRKADASNDTPRPGVYTSPPPGGRNPFMLLRLIEEK
jgi:hypothetical protein